MSLAVTALLIKESKNRSLKNCLEIEYRLSQKMTNRHDFGEGIQSVLIEKHHHTQWKPKTIDEINNNELISLFSDSIDNELKL